MLAHLGKRVPSIIAKSPARTVATHNLHNVESELGSLAGFKTSMIGHTQSCTQSSSSSLSCSHPHHTSARGIPSSYPSARRELHTTSSLSMPASSRHTKDDIDPDSVVPPYYVERKRQRDAVEERKEMEGSLMYELNAGLISGDIAASTRRDPRKVPTEFATGNGAVIHPSGFVVPSPGVAVEPMADRRHHDLRQQTAAVAERVSEEDYKGVNAQLRTRAEKVPFEVVEVDGSVRHPSGFEPPTPVHQFPIDKWMEAGASKTRVDKVRAGQKRQRVFVEHLLPGKGDFVLCRCVRVMDIVHLNPGIGFVTPPSYTSGTEYDATCLCSGLNSFDMTTFVRDETASIVSEFRRLALQEGWTRRSKTYKAERRHFFGEAAVEEFHKYFGENVSSLQAWQDLCRQLGVVIDGMPPGSITECKRLLKGVYVNIVDLVDSQISGNTVKTFSSAKDLSKYIRRTGKVFPRERAKANPLLRQFLIIVT
ncbi:hypothetical protein EW146_g8659 [Bondarzewia mesenterica]|uniref:Uncharacterized protein n=1 Tax=Bondarzewia mesenterica TaxID=1095465 RepID=A0A4S4LCP8_9AGAM|nr:hypothetical protein EW146_g8659 [Bondarzewia mesenterica]